MEDLVMKRIYIKPTTTVMELEPQVLISASIDINSSGVAVDAGDAATKERGEWDIWDEEYD